MQFLRSLRDRIKSGEITSTVRLWQRPHVKVGGRYALPPGQVVVTNMFEVSLADITPALARRTGFVGVVDLLKVARHGAGRRVFVIEFRYVTPGRAVPRRSRAWWQCPKCGHRFVTRHLWHSCGRFSLARHFAGKPAALRAAFRRWVTIARACGPVTVYAQKTRIVLQARVRFAGAVVRSQWLDAALWLRRRVGHPRMHRIESFGRLGYGIHFRLSGPADIDARIVDLMREAYAAARARS
jgi:hypothetical protein